jgi:hypothetical protein
MKFLITFLLASSFGLSSAWASPRKVIVTVGKENAGAAWAKEKCDFIHESVNKSSEGNISTNCIWIQNNEMINSSVQKETRTGKYSYLIDLRENENGSQNIRIVNLNRQDDTDLIQLGWKIEKNDESKIALHKIIKNFFEVDLFKKEVKTFFLVNGINESKEVSITKKGEFLDQAGEVISSEQAYKIFASENAKNKHYLRAGLEIVAGLGLGTVNYYIHKEINARDWDFKTIKDAFDSKFVTGTGYRFDDNSIGVNTGHAYAGTIYYMLARSNGFSSMESFLLTFAASTAWEFIAEFREVVSINDQLVTPLGGFAIGEGLHQIAKIFGKKNNSLVDKAIGSIFDTSTALNNWINKNYSEKKDIRDTGFNQDFWSRFDIEASMTKNDSTKSALKYGFDAEIINISEFEETGVKTKLISDTAFTRMILSIPNNFNVGEEYKFVVKNALAAYYKKNLGKNSKGNIEGYNFLIGPSNGVELDSKNDNIPEGQDFMSVINVLGSTMDLTLYSNGYKIRTTIDVFANFAMIRSFAINSYKELGPKKALTSVLASNDYYYAKGMTTAVNISVSKGKISFGAGYSDQRFNSINTHHRDEEYIKNEMALNDKKKELEVWIAFQISKSLKAKLSYSDTNRSGEIRQFGVFETNEKRTTGTLIYNFK